MEVRAIPGLKIQTWGTPVRGEGLGGGFGEDFGVLAHLGGALDLVPVEGLAVDGAEKRFEEDDREYLAVGKALQPNVEQKPAVALCWLDGGARA